MFAQWLLVEVHRADSSSSALDAPPCYWYNELEHTGNESISICKEPLNAAKERQVSMQQPHIISHLEIMLGKPVITGTRITVEHILEQLAGGRTIAQILAIHPHINYEDVQAAIMYVTF